jgi:hypothetical protein
VTSPTKFYCGKQDEWDRQSFPFVDQQIESKETQMQMRTGVALYNFLSTFSGTHFFNPKELHGRASFHSEHYVLGRVAHSFAVFANEWGIDALKGRTLVAAA